jgi:hypothetical protein
MRPALTAALGGKLPDRGNRRLKQSRDQDPSNGGLYGWEIATSSGVIMSGHERCEPRKAYTRRHMYGFIDGNPWGTGPRGRRKGNDK